MDVFRNSPIFTNLRSRAAFAWHFITWLFPGNRLLVLMPMSGQSHSRLPQLLDSFREDTNQSI